MRFPLLAVGFALTVALGGCSDDGPTGLSTIAGSYELISVDGEPPSALGFNSAILTLRGNGTCELGFDPHVNDFLTGGVGSWRLEGKRVSVALRLHQSDVELTGMILGNTLLLEDESRAFVFDKQ